MGEEVGVEMGRQQVRGDLKRTSLILAEGWLGIYVQKETEKKGLGQDVTEGEHWGQVSSLGCCH